MSEKVTLIGLDGAPWPLINKWVSEKKLPTFKKIAESGLKGILKSTIPSTTFPAVPALFTGMNPGNLGIFSFTKSNGEPFTLQDVEYDKLWEVISKNEKKVCVINIPLSFPPDKVNGVMISGWAPSDESDYTYPEELKNEVKGFRAPILHQKRFKLRNNKKIRRERVKLLETCLKMLEIRYDVFKKLNKEIEYDFAVLWIYQSDFLQHCCWEYENILLQLYTRIDEILHDMLSTFHDRNLFIVSDHGFESKPSKYFFVNRWLLEKGYLRQKRSFINHFINFFQFFAYNYMKRRHISKLMKYLKTIKPNVSESDSKKKLMVQSFNDFTNIDIQNSHAYLNTMFGIKVKKSSKYEYVREKIIKELKNIKDDNNINVVRSVGKKENIYEGKHLKNIPDIIFLTSENYVPFPSLTKNIFGKVKRSGYWWQSGEHYRARDGILFACGPAIKNKQNLVNGNIEDIFPTILYLLGCPIPDYTDGSIIKELCALDREPIFLSANVKNERSYKKTEQLRKEDEEKIIERLKKLGYI